MRSNYSVFILPLFSGALLCWLNSGCIKTDPETYSGTGKRPVYTPLSELNDIRNLPPQTIQLSGTIFLQDSLFFMLDQKKGIHVFNVKDSSNTVNLTFFNIPAITDFTIAGTRLYADSWRDLVILDISDLYNIQVVDRIPDVLSPILYPPLYNGIFECVDESKGAVVGWEDAELEEVRCISVN